MFINRFCLTLVYTAKQEKLHHHRHPDQRQNLAKQTTGELMDELFLAACEENGISFCAKYIRKQLDLDVRDSNGCSGIMKVNLFYVCKLLIFTETYTNSFLKQDT